MKDRSALAKSSTIYTLMKAYCMRHEPFHQTIPFTYSSGQVWQDYHLCIYSNNNTIINHDFLYVVLFEIMCWGTYHIIEYTLVKGMV